MEAPTEWTYGGKLDWSSADTLRLVPIGMAVRCIVEALKERAEAANYTLPEILTADYNPFAVQYPVVSAIQTAVTALISRFCNHQTGSGDYTGLSSVPIWTQSDILTAIGAVSRIIHVRLGFLREWTYQQFQILNFLRWSECTIGGYTMWYDAIKMWYGTGGTISSCLADWKESAESIGYNGTKKSANYSAGKAQFKYGVYKNSSLISFDNFDCSYDFYLSGTTRPSEGNNEFNAQGDGVLLDQIINIGSGFMTMGDPMVPSDYFPSSNSPIYFSETTGAGWFPKDVYSVLKFDGENGFKFRDW